MYEQKYSIRDLEEITGIKAHTIRIWEQRFSLFEPERTPTNIRLYSDEDLKKLLNILILYRQGIRISKLAALTKEELNDWVRGSTSAGKPDDIIDSLIVDMVDFNGESIDRKLNRIILNLGFEETVYRVIAPFFQKVGILWQTGAINPAQEHFMSNLFKQKFFIAIDALDTLQPTAKTFLLFLRENEQHELSLLMAHYLIRKYGQKAIYLGQSVPLADVVSAWEVIRPDYLVTHLTSMIAPEELTAYLSELSANTGGTPILVSGRPALELNGGLPANIIHLQSPPDLARLLSAR